MEGNGSMMRMGITVAVAAAAAACGTTAGTGDDGAADRSDAADEAVSDDVRGDVPGTDDAAGVEDDAGDDADGGPAAPDLASVRFWAYQIQAVDSPGAVDDLAGSHYDMLVLEPTRTDWSSDAREFDARAMVERLKATAGGDGARRKLVVAYVDIGEAEDWRWYWTWSDEWPEGELMPADWPDFIVGRDPDGWSGNYPVAFWDPEWQDIIIHGEEHSAEPYGDYRSAVDEVVRDGFDGIYLDWVEAYADANVAARAAEDGVDPAEEMIDFIDALRAWARARDPDFLVIQQNASGLAVGRPRLFGVIDALAQEAIWFDGAADTDWDDPAGHDAPTDPATTAGYLDDLAPYRAAALPVFACEYAVDHAAEAYGLAAAQGFVPYSTRRALDRLTTEPPPGY